MQISISTTSNADHAIDFMETVALPQSDRHTTSHGQLLIACGLVTIAWALVYLPWLGLLDLLLEEPRRALIIRTMLETGDFLVPRLGGEIYTAKPPLFNWLIGISAALGGELNELTARLPAAVAVLLLTLVLLITLRRWLSLRGLLFTGMALVLAPEFIAKGSLAEIETVFTLLVTLSIWSWYLLDQRRAVGWRLWLLPLFFVALAYLTKREPAIVFFYLSVVPYLLVRRRWREVVTPGHVLSGFIVVVIVGGWLSLVAWQTGWTALWETLQREVLQRGATQSWQAVVQHIVLYPLELLVAMLPFSLLLPFLFGGQIRRSLVNRYGTLPLFCALAVLINLPVYWFRGDVSVRYFMPMFPFAMLLAAMVFEILWDERDQLGTIGKRYLRVLIWTCLGVAVVFSLLLLISITVPWFSEERIALLSPWLALGVTVVAGAVVWWCFQNRTARAALAMLSSFVLVVLLGRALYFNLLLPDKALRVQQERNAPAIVQQIGELSQDAAVHARGVPWAVWYYAPAELIVPLKNDQTEPGQWLLVDTAYYTEERAQRWRAEERGRFSYKGETLLLLQVADGPSADPQ